MTVLQVLVFLGIVWWAFGGSRKKRFEQDAMLALDDDDLKGREQEHARHR
ncbi:MAG: CcoQ/FixQ family Cbb3-type cytochrome c oxidase assembly chaperone [Betaproteobacteria bacterium]|nr:CcoQ/FixQ family Cbb3-type cytochrome c oxidase assembly chaperone [Betaproteobacteria bacterium]